MKFIKSDMEIHKLQKLALVTVIKTLITKPDIHPIMSSLDEDNVTRNMRDAWHATRPGMKKEQAIRFNEKKILAYFKNIQKWAAQQRPIGRSTRTRKRTIQTRSMTRSKPPLYVDLDRQLGLAPITYGELLWMRSGRITHLCAPGLNMLFKMLWDVRCIAREMADSDLPIWLLVESVKLDDVGIADVIYALTIAAHM